MKKISALLASLFVFAVLVSAPAYTDYTDFQGVENSQNAPQTPDAMSFL